MLTVKVDIDFIPPSIEFGVVNQYVFYGGAKELGPMDSAPTSTNFNPVSEVRKNLTDFGIYVCL